jgi:hypothetical protein
MKSEHLDSIDIITIISFSSLLIAGALFYFYRPNSFPPKNNELNNKMSELRSIVDNSVIDKIEELPDIELFPNIEILEKIKKDTDNT